MNFSVAGYEDEIRNMKITLTKEQIKDIMDRNFNMNCDFCTRVFDSVKEARAHYLSEHDMQYGYVKCCNIKLRHNSIILDHIQWHIKPDTFKYVSNQL